MVLLIQNPELTYEYIYYNDTWERIGSTGINLDGYWNDEDLAIATNTDINK